MSQYGPPEDPSYYSEQQYAYSQYDGGPPGAPPPGGPEEPPTPWWRQPWALFLLGIVAAIILGLVVYAIVRLTNRW